MTQLFGERPSLRQKDRDSTMRRLATVAIIGGAHLLFPEGGSLCLSFDTPGRSPEHPRCGDGIDSPSLPPSGFVSEAMDVTVMGPAQRHRELIADLASHGAGLSKL